MGSGADRRSWSSNWCVICKQNVFWFPIEARYEKNPLPSLRHAKPERIDNTISPPVTKAFELVNDCSHSLTSMQLEHEGDVLEHDPGNLRARLAQKPKHLCYKYRLLAG